MALVNPPLPLAVYQQRRHKLASHFDHAVIVVPTHPQMVRSADTHFRFRPSSDMLYLCGCDEPEAVLLLVVQASRLVSSLLLCRPNDAVAEAWEGPRLGPNQAPEFLGLDQAYPLDQLASLINKLDHPSCSWVFRHGQSACLDLEAVLPHRRSELAPALNRLRMIKDSHELELMQRACDISSLAHIRLRQALADAEFEYQLEASLLHSFRSQGASGEAYSSIVAGGANACVLHYSSNQARLEAGQLVLVDAACEFAGYASDITRTYAVSGRYSSQQQELYAAVLEAQQEAIAKARAGQLVEEVHRAACRALSRNLIELGLITGPVDQALSQQLYRPYYFHHTSHLLGLDVHDVGVERHERDQLVLAAGMVITVEPGLYVNPSSEGFAQAYAGIGIRIEDDILITEGKPQVLSAACPKSVAELSW